MTELDQAQAALDAARRGDNPSGIAEALVRHANALVEQGQVGQARRELDEAASIHREQDRVYDEARCTHLSATLCRLEGDLAGSRQRARHARRLAGPGNPIAVSAATELGETALAEGKATEAASAYADALEDGRAAGLIGPAQAELLRKRAVALSAAGEYQEAARELGAAYDLLLEAGDQATATRVLVERASALHNGGAPSEREAAVTQAVDAARQSGDDHALADLYLLQCAQAVDRQDTAAALALARQAREHALAAVAPVFYMGAAVAIAELSEAAGDRLGCYEALAVGWVTVADLLGREASRSAFEPKLVELRRRWGADAFNRVKADYEARRRQARG